MNKKVYSFATFTDTELNWKQNNNIPVHFNPLTDKNERSLENMYTVYIVYTRDAFI